MTRIAAKAKAKARLRGRAGSPPREYESAQSAIEFQGVPAELPFALLMGEPHWAERRLAAWTHWSVETLTDRHFRSPRVRSAHVRFGAPTGQH